MDASKRLTAAHDALADGRYAEALEGLVWFHEHALAETPGLYGVRLSYALGAWVELALLYAPAMTALRAMRDRTAESLLTGIGGRDEFHDVKSIDEYLHEVDQTYRLYVEIEARHADTARVCGLHALDAMLHMGDFERAARIVPEPETAIQRASGRLHENLVYSKRRGFSVTPDRWVFIGIYVDQVKQVLAIVNGLGQSLRAQTLAQLALDATRSPSVRRDVKAGLVRPAPAPAPGRKRLKLQARRARQRATAERRLERMQRSR